MSELRVPLPGTLVAAAREEGREEWLDGVPSIVGRFADEWSLSVEAPLNPVDRPPGWLLPVTFAVRSWC